MPKKYRDVDGSILAVEAGIGGKEYGVFRRKPGKQSSHKVVSKNLPMCATAEEAQRNLDAWVGGRLQEVEG